MKSKHDRALEIFAAASELKAADRNDYLTRACGNDHTLRREIDSLFEYHAERTIIDATLPDAVAPKPRAFRKQRWSKTPVPVTVVVGLFVVTAFWLHYRIGKSLEHMVEEKLERVLSADVAALEHWLELQKTLVSLWAQNPQVESTVREIVLSSEETNPNETELKDLREELHRILDPLVKSKGFSGFGVISPRGIIVAASQERRVGKELSDTGKSYQERVDKNEVVLVIPGREQKISLPLEIDQTSAMLAVAAPVYYEKGDDPIAALSMAFEANDEFTRILALASFGESGESYAYDKHAVLLSEIRHREKLEELGDLSPGQPSALNVVARLPTATSEQSPTDGSTPDLSGQNGSNVFGYKNYCGAGVVGAWRWLPAFEFGVATEIGIHEAYRPLLYIKRSFLFILFVVVSLSVTAVFSTLRISRLRKRLNQDRFGAYKLGKKLGEGGMGQVYMAEHERLRRPAAIKLITRPDANDRTLARFEREVQITCNLQHPNTIQVYDYGVSEKGDFYYAMELLEGITLGQLVRSETTIPPSRTIYLLKQVCGSLLEAHEQGLLHRDIKPANVMISERAGLSDFVKVLDFGIAKPIRAVGAQNVTQADVVLGTPVFMAPERAITPEDVDERSDIFSVGAIGFYMLTGRFPFNGSSPMEIIRKMTRNDGQLRPSQATRNNIPKELDNLVAECLIGDPNLRPATMVVVSEELSRLSKMYEWRQAQAKSWWLRYRESQTTTTQIDIQQKTEPFENP